MDLPKRKPLRLENYDYSEANYYFVTLCTAGRRKVLSEIDVGANCVRPPSVCLLPTGLLVKREIQRISQIYPAVRVEKYVVMPNHIHMILAIGEENGRTQFAPTLSRIIKQFKGTVTKKAGCSVWQKSFYDHVIRGEEDYRDIWEYIENNPARWAEDKLYTE